MTVTADARGRRRRALWAFGAALAIVVTAAFVALRSHDGSPVTKTRPHPLAVVPPGPAFALSVDLRALRQSHPGAALLGQGLAKLKGEPCEKVLAAELDELALAVPAAPPLAQAATDALAVVATGRFSGHAVIACAEQRIRARHGEPVTTTLGTFASVRDRRAAGEIAARDGLAVLSDGPYLRELLDGADGRRAEGTPDERTRDALHAELRRAFGRGAPVIATLALPPGWLAKALADPNAERSPLAAIRSAALRLEPSDPLTLTALVACANPTELERVARFFENARVDLAPLLAPESAPLLARISVIRRGAELELSGKFSAAELAGLWPR